MTPNAANMQNVAEYYANHFKGKQDKSSAQKLKFMYEVLDAKKFDAAFWKRWDEQESHKFTEQVEVEKEWISWTQLKTNEGEAVGRLMIKQGKVRKRPHAKSDHESEDTKALPEEEQHQYKYDRANERDSFAKRLKLTRDYAEDDGGAEAVDLEGLLGEAL